MRISLGIRKIVVLILVGSISLLANVWFVVKWLDEHGVVGWAQHVRSEFITGTAITIIFVGQTKKKGCQQFGTNQAVPGV